MGTSLRVGIEFDLFCFAIKSNLFWARRMNSLVWSSKVFRANNFLAKASRASSRFEDPFESTGLPEKVKKVCVIFGLKKFFFHQNTYQKRN